MRAFDPVRKNYKKALNHLWYDQTGPSLAVLDPRTDFQNTPLRQQTVLQNHKRFYRSSSRRWNRGQGRNPLPSIDKILPPAMKHRDFQMNLSASFRYLSSHQTDTTANSFDMFFTKRGRKNQVPDPKRQVISQLGTQKIGPVGHKSSQGQMRQKLVGKPERCIKEWSFEIGSAKPQS